MVSYHEMAMKIKKILILFTLSVAFVFNGCTSTSDCKKASASEGTIAGGLQMSLVLGASEYEMSPDYKSDDFKEMISSVRRGKENVVRNKFVSPEINGNLVFKNVSKENVVLVEPNNDSVQVTFKLDGDGAVAVKNLVPMTMEFRIGTSVTLKPGEEYSYYVKNMDGGMRGKTESVYWTKPGKYTITAVYQHAKEDGKLILTSAPVTVNVK